MILRKIYFIRYCKWYDCSIKLSESNHYCKDHRRNAYLKSKIKYQKREKEIREELKTMKDEEFKRIYDETMKKIKEEENAKKIKF